MLLDIIVEKMYFVFKRNIYLSSIIRQENKRGGGCQILDWTYARGGGVIQMRTVCNRGGGGGVGLKIGKKCVCN